VWRASMTTQSAFAQLRRFAGADVGDVDASEFFDASHDRDLALDDDDDDDDEDDEYDDDNADEQRVDDGGGVNGAHARRAAGATPMMLRVLRAANDTFVLRVNFLLLSSLKTTFFLHTV
jgi:hypothetical protein